MDSVYLRIAKLIDLYIREEISQEEMDELDLLQKKYPQIKEWLENKEYKKSEIQRRYEHYQSQNVILDWQKILSKSRFDLNRKRRVRWVVAASIALLVSVGVWEIQKLGHQNSAINTFTNGNFGIVPGKEKAILTLSDGSKISLDENSSQTVNEGSLEIYIQNNKLDYKGSTSSTVYSHKLSVPVGATYNIQLSDGTKVWLNADSELEFPSVFKGNDRIV